MNIVRRIDAQADKRPLLFFDVFLRYQRRPPIAAQCHQNAPNFYITGQLFQKLASICDANPRLFIAEKACPDWLKLGVVLDQDSSSDVIVDYDAHRLVPRPTAEKAPLLLEEEATVIIRWIDQVAQTIHFNEMTLCFQALTVQVQERNHFRGNLSRGNFLTETIDEIVAVRFDHQAAVVLGGKLREECSKRGLRARVKMDLRLL